MKLSKNILFNNLKLNMSPWSSLSPTYEKCCVSLFTILLESMGGASLVE